VHACACTHIHTHPHHICAHIGLVTAGEPPHVNVKLSGRGRERPHANVNVTLLLQGVFECAFVHVCVYVCVCVYLSVGVSESMPFL